MNGFGTLQNSPTAGYAVDPSGQQEKVARPRDVSNELSALEGVTRALNMTTAKLRERLDPVMRTVAPVGESAQKVSQSPSTKLGAEIRAHHDFLREIEKTLSEVLDRLEV